MSLRIAVMIKQVPAGQILMNEETGNLMRTSHDTCMNPYDYSAIETALHIAKQIDSTIDVYTMGPVGAQSVLREALVLGASNAFLLTDKAFAGSDALATSRALCGAINKNGPYSLVITGAQSTDGDTAQVSGTLAALLGISYMPWVSSISSIGLDSITVFSKMDESRIELRCDYPLLMSVLPGIFPLSVPSLAGRMQSKKKTITTIAAENIGVDVQSVGSKGSRTRVVRVSGVTKDSPATAAVMDAGDCIAHLEEISSEFRR